MAMRQHSLTGAGRVTGSVTVFLALSLSASLLFTETALESARAFLLRAQAQTALESALDSLFAGYDTELFDRYGLLFLNRGRTVKNRSVEAIVEDAMGAELNPPGGGCEKCPRLYEISCSGPQSTGDYRRGTNFGTRGGGQKAE